MLDLGARLRGATRLVYADFLAETRAVGRGGNRQETGAMWAALADLAGTAAEPATATPDLAEQLSCVHDIEVELACALGRVRARG